MGKTVRRQNFNLSAYNEDFQQKLQRDGISQDLRWGQNAAGYAAEGIRSPEAKRIAKKNRAKMQRRLENEMLEEEMLAYYCK